MPVPHAPSHSPDVAAPAAFVCTRSADGVNSVHLQARGRLDADTAPHLQDALLSALGDARLVVVDLLGVEAIDAAGVAAIADASQQARANGQRLLVVRAREQVEAALRLDLAQAGVAIIGVDGPAGTDPRATSAFSVELYVREANGRPISEVACRGEADIAAEPELRAALSDAQSGHVIVDLAGTTFMDSSALECLLHAHRAIHSRGDRLVVACPAGPARRLLQLIAVEEALGVVDDVQAAELALQG